MKFIVIPRNASTTFTTLLQERDDVELIKNARAVPPEQLNEVFAIIRNPYDRAVSLVADRDDAKLSKERFKHYWTDWIWAQEIFRPQVTWLKYPGGIVTNVIRFEELEKYDLPRLNESQRDRDFNIYYDDEVREIVYERYKEDFELLGYEK